MNDLCDRASAAYDAIIEMGGKRMRDVAQTLDVVQEYARADRGFKEDCKRVVLWLRLEADFLDYPGTAAEEH